MNRPSPRSLRTSDGTLYQVRPIDADDAAGERAFIMNLSPQSRYQRLMYTIIEPSPAFVAQLCHIDGHRNMALVALAGAGADESIIAIARYAADDNGLDCEFAVAVADAWQCRGIGATLTKLLFEHATREGFRSIYGDILADNPRMLALAEWLGLTVETVVEGQTTVRASRRLGPSQSQ
jgi:acetyltransferase